MTNEEWKLVVHKLASLIGPLKGDASAPGFYETYREVLISYNYVGVMDALGEIPKHETFYPVPATVLKYYPERSSRAALPEPERTPDQLRRSELVKHYWLREFSIEDDKARAKVRASQSQADLEAFIKEHWDDPNIPRVRGEGFERIAKGR